LWAGEEVLGPLKPASTLSALFIPPPWLRNPHIQTLWPKLFRKRPVLPLRHQRLELADGDFIDLAWADDVQGPVVLVLHGLEGNLRSHYALPVMAALA
jgi:predicted alpha/beta-fold hydrolase